MGNKIRLILSFIFFLILVCCLGVRVEMNLVIFVLIFLRFNMVLLVNDWLLFWSLVVSFLFNLRGKVWLVGGIVNSVWVWDVKGIYGE